MRRYTRGKVIPKLRIVRIVSNMSVFYSIPGREWAAYARKIHKRMNKRWKCEGRKRM